MDHLPPVQLQLASSCRFCLFDIDPCRAIPKHVNKKHLLTPCLDANIEVLLDAIIHRAAVHIHMCIQIYVGIELFVYTCVCIRARLGIRDHDNNFPFGVEKSAVTFENAWIEVSWDFLLREALHPKP